MKNILTIDVEDYFQVETFKNIIDNNEWDNFELRVENSLKKVLNLINSFDYKATFFVLGWIAEKFPEIIKMISDQGHEISTHGYGHELVYKQTKQEFKNDLIKSINTLKNITGKEILGYRAPTFSITNDSLWALDIIKELGLEYDASISPIEGHDKYGIMGINPCIHTLFNGLVELPQTTIKILTKNVPVAGGGYFRLLPYWLTKMAIKKLNKNNKTAIVYLHPWEFDPEQPKIKGISKLSQFRHYINIDKTEDKFKKMLSDFNFTSIEKYLEINEVEKNV
ncbi:XrtA system polysaccharide deacetylase [Halanaerobium sp.]|uniref:XrtA system polysaccharide deacetylase n=1 Tax=Halanaerobium sp. TaxID=1895664 RepID=UPI000DE68019|nr:XrtA system polysaccharide deacetylase [Halanaerobium sp.]PUU89884.1 MAG: Polysaccharide deacetylase [Halanaerobium sp.]